MLTQARPYDTPRTPASLTRLPEQNEHAPNLEIGGFTPLTTIDFPGRLAAVVFCQGCPWRCRYCQNGHLIPRSAEDPVDWRRLVKFLEHRVGLLDGVVFSGGEPTLQASLPEAIRWVKSLGYQIGLHTAGPYPKRLQPVLPLVDWVGFDIKTLPGAYPAVTGVPASGDRVLESAKLVLENGVAHEFRTTVHPALTNLTTLRDLAGVLADMGVKHYVLQECISGHCLDENLRGAQASSIITPPLAEEIGARFPSFSVRHA